MKRFLYKGKLKQELNVIKRQFMMHDSSHKTRLLVLIAVKAAAQKHTFERRSAETMR